MVHLEAADLNAIPAATTLEIQPRRFVVCRRIGPDAVEVADPATGFRTMPLTAVRSSTGVAIVFEPTEGFTKGDTRPKRAAMLLEHLLEQRGTIAQLVGISILVQLLSAALPLMTGVLIDRVVPRQDYSLLLLLAVGYSALQLFNGLSAFVRERLSVHLRTRIESAFTLRFLDHLIELPYEFFQRRTPGDLMMRLGSHRAVRDILTSTLLSTFLDGIMASVYLVILVLFSIPLTLLVILLGAARLLVLAIMRWKQRSLLAESLDNQARAQTAQVEMLGGMETLKAMGLDHRAASAWSSLFTEGQTLSVRRGRLDATFHLILNTLGLVSTVLLMFYGAYLVLEGVWSLGSLMAFNALAMGFLGPLNNLMSSALQLQMLEVYLERLNDVWSTPREQEGKGRLIAGALSGSVELERVSFRYGPEAPCVLQNLSVRMAAGSRVAIVGRTGAGKSSLARLIAGLYEPTAGRILLDGKDLQALDRRSVRRQLGIVTQDAQLFGGSIRRNIAFADPDMSLDRIVAAAKMACVHDDIMAMAMEYDTPLADCGRSLSGGQRQRLAIARALAGDPKILILDEATSHLDGLTEEKVNANLACLRCTTIVIAHRLSTIQEADLILVLEGGRIVQAGRHEHLNGSDGTYAGLAAAQHGSRERIARATTAGAV
jgi:ATP-binding cassette subfamily B protein